MTTDKDLAHDDLIEAAQKIIDKYSLSSEEIMELSDELTDWMILEKERKKGKDEIAFLE